MKYFKEFALFYLPLCVLAGYAGMALFGPVGFWLVYGSLSFYGLHDNEKRFYPR